VALCAARGVDTAWRLLQRMRDGDGRNTEINDDATLLQLTTRDDS